MTRPNKPLKLGVWIKKGKTVYQFFKSLLYPQMHNHHETFNKDYCIVLFGNKPDTGNLQVIRDLHTLNNNVLEKTIYIELATR